MSQVYEDGMRKLQEVLDRPVPRRAPTAEYLLLKAAAVATDQGTFEAVISSEAVDRERDVVLAPAMVNALRLWDQVGKKDPAGLGTQRRGRGHHRPYRPLLGQGCGW